ncbi:MAG: geranylgeranylglycerol-phosphate geranylgeranyltransferase [Candidatus Limimorpha sp.]
MKKLLSLLKLVRLPNLIITTMMMSFVYHGLMKANGDVAFTFLVVSIVLIVAGGYVINDVFDVSIDAINKPSKQIVGVTLSEKQCRFFYWTLTGLGLSCALVSSVLKFQKEFFTMFLFVLLLACLLYSYSSRYKRKLVVGNIIVSLSVAFAVFLPWLYEMLYLSKHEALLALNDRFMVDSLHFVLVYTSFAFLTTLIREIIKDMEDVDGDGLCHCRTIPLTWGMKTAAIIIMVLLFVLLVLLFVYSSALRIQLGLRWASLSIDVVKYLTAAELLLILFSLLKNRLDSEKTLRILSSGMKIIMLLGVISMLFIV